MTAVGTPSRCRQTGSEIGCGSHEADALGVVESVEFEYLAPVVRAHEQVVLSAGNRLRHGQVHAVVVRLSGGEDGCRERRARCWRGDCLTTH